MTPLIPVILTQPNSGFADCSPAAPCTAPVQLSTAWMEQHTAVPTGLLETDDPPTLATLKAAEQSCHISPSGGHFHVSSKTSLPSPSSL